MVEDIGACGGAALPIQGLADLCGSRLKGCSLVKVATAGSSCTVKLEQQLGDVQPDQWMDQRHRPLVPDSWSDSAGVVKM